MTAEKRTYTYARGRSVPGARKLRGSSAEAQKNCKMDIHLSRKLTEAPRKLADVHKPRRAEARGSLAEAFGCAEAKPCVRKQLV